MPYTINENNIKIKKFHLQKQIDYTQNLINELERVHNGFAEICAKFNNKVYSKRFNTAVEKLSPLLRIEYSVGQLYLNACDWNNRHYTADVGQRGYISTSYVKNDTIKIFLASKNFTDSNLILSYEKLLDNYSKFLESNKKSLEQLRKDLANIDSIIAEFADLKQRCENFTYNVSGLVRELFWLKF